MLFPREIARVPQVSDTNVRYKISLRRKLLCQHVPFVQEHLYGFQKLLARRSRIYLQDAAEFHLPV